MIYIHIPDILSYMLSFWYLMQFWEEGVGAAIKQSLDSSQTALSRGVGWAACLSHFYAFAAHPPWLSVL